MEPILELRSVSKTYRASGYFGQGARVVQALDDVSLTVGCGEIVGLVGGSGAGKSTLGRLVLGLERPDNGEVLFESTDVARLSGPPLRTVRHRMHLILQDPYQSLHPGLRLADLVAEPLVIAGAEPATRAARVHQALEEVGLTPVHRYVHRFPHELSGGQRQRVAIARGFVNRPRLIVADEPTSMLDVSLRAGILDLLLRLRSRYGTACIFITHDLAVARYISDRIGVIQNGRLVEVGPAEDVIAQPRHAYTRALLAASEGSDSGCTAGN